MPYIWFDPDVTSWSSLDQFEYFFARSLNAVGLEAERIQSYPKDAFVVLIKAKPSVTIPDVTTKNVGRPKSVKGQLEALMPKGASHPIKKGKFIKSKGYREKEV